MMDLRKAPRAHERDVSMPDLLSIDADAHLQKLAACMFPTPAQLPVELVRASLKRGATAVAVTVQRRRLAIDDDGQGIAEADWRELACAFDPGRNAMDRERAIAALQGAASPGIGLLSIFVPGAESIRVEDAGAVCRVMHIANGRVRQLENRPKGRGTRIRIFRRAGPAETEKRLLRELCAAVPQDITLNGRQIEKKSLLRRVLAQQDIDLGPSRGKALVAVPARGDVCRIWLLEQRIPWQAFTSAAYHGLVFEAFLETGSPPTGPELGLMAHAAYRLYQWLAGNYLSFPGKYQERIEELLFKRARSTGDLHLLAAFTPFRIWRSKERLSLEEVRRKAEKSILFALPSDSDPGRFLGRHQEALLLTPLQRDFLLNHLSLPLAAPPLPMGRQGRLPSAFYSARGRIVRLFSRLPRPRLQAPPPERLRSEETALCREMENHWQRLHPRGLSAPPPPLAVVMADGRGLFPAVWRIRHGGNVLHLRRRHPLVVRAADIVARDRANVELACVALAPELFLTAPGQ